MAHKEMLAEGETKRWIGASMFWNVSSSVGYGCTNKKADVLLVQFFLNSIARFENKLDQLLVPDGKFGGQTWSRIKTVQREAGGFCVADGTVSSVSGNRLYTPKQKLIYTIIVLNRYYALQRRNYYADIRMDPNCPQALIGILSGPMPQLV